MKYLFLFTIGPVQSFIAQARKTQDLWAGSYLLSFLIHKARNYLINELGIKADAFIFPDESNKLDKFIASLPNRLLIIADSPKEIGEKLELFIKKLYQEMLSFSVKLLAKKVSIKFDEFDLNIEKQLENFLEIYWIAVPYNKNEHNKSYIELESLIGARKNIKKFVYTEETGIKCPICGERSAIYIKNRGKKKEILELWEKISNRYPKIKHNETLCPICLSKRMLPEYIKHKSSQNETAFDYMFPSTAEVAASKLKNSLINQNRFNSLEEIFPVIFKKPEFRGTLLPKNSHLLGRFNTIDGHWLHKENYTQKEYLKYFKNSNNISEEEFLNIPKKIKDFTKNKKISYYAIVFMDGDNMGKKIIQLNYNEHKIFSKTLADFSSKIVPKIVESKYLGKLIYAGGDDIVALVNLDDLLDVVESLREAFSKEMEGLRNKLSLSEENFTMSAGICISHYKTPFSLSIKVAKEMEQKAKSFTDNFNNPVKNAVSISIMTHGGNNKATLFPWEYNVNSKSIVLMKKLQKLISDDVISKNFIYNLKDEFSNLLDKDGFLSEIVKNKRDEILKSEINRIISRKTNKNISKNMKKEIEYFTNQLFEFCKLGLKSNIKDFLSYLEVANVIAREV